MDHFVLKHLLHKWSVALALTSWKRTLKSNSDFSNTKIHSLELGTKHTNCASGLALGSISWIFFAWHSDESVVLLGVIHLRKVRSEHSESTSVVPNCVLTRFSKNFNNAAMATLGLIIGSMSNNPKSCSKGQSCKNLRLAIRASRSFRLGFCLQLPTPKGRPWLADKI